MTGKPFAGTLTMNRQQREDELRTMLTTQRGKEELLEILKKHAGIEGGNLPPFGTLLVDTILNYEFPAEHDENPAGPQPEAVGANVPSPSEKTEPGDAKFADPPGQEAPGG
jgi:hypothetical protein